MEPEQLANVLAYTFSPDPSLRAQAEAAIKALPTVDGAPQALLQIIGAGAQVQREVRQSAAIAFKNIAKTYWEPMMRITKAQCVPDESKPAIREMLFQILLLEADKSVRDLLAEAVNQFARVDYPLKWPQLLPDILTHVQSGEPLRMHNALLALRQVTKRLEYKMKENRAPLEVIIHTALPVTQQLMRQLIETENNSLEAAMIMKLCLKILWSSTQFSLPLATLGDDPDPAAIQHLCQWLELIGAVVMKPLPEAEEPNAQPPDQPKKLEERNAWPWWKLKKWALQILARWFHRYGMPQYADDESQKFAKLFSSTYAPKLLEPVMHILSLGPSNRFCTDRCTHLSFVFVDSAVQLKYAILKPHMRSLLLDIVFPSLSLSDADVALFESDPLEFVRKSNDVMEDFVDPKMSAMTLLENVMKNRKKDNLDMYLNFLTETLNQYAQGACGPQKKDGVMVSLCVLSEFLKKHKKYASQLEPLIVTHVFPEFQSPVGYLRSRAASMTNSFCDIKFKNFANVSRLLELMLGALRDSCLPVQVEAANGLRCLIELEGTEAMLLPILPDLLNEFFRIMGEIGNDSVVAALDSIINKFGDELIPHATLLVQKLCESFLTYAGDGTDGEDDEAAMAACQCIEAVSTVLDAMVKSDQSGHLLVEVQPFLVPVLQLVLRPDGDYIEYLESALEILTFVTYFVEVKVDKNDAAAVHAAKQQTAQALRPYVDMFPLIVHAFHNYAYDYMANMMSPIDNIIGFATDQFINSVEPNSGESYVQLMLGMTSKVYTSGGKSSTREAVSGTHLLMSLLHNCHGKVDAYLPSVLGLVFDRLNPQPIPRQIPLRIPEGVPEGTMIPLGGMPGEVACPAGAPGTEVMVTINVAEQHPPDKLKISLLQVINSAFYYNPLLTCHWLELVPGRCEGFFNAWCAEMDQSQEWNHLAAKLAAMALASLLNAPLEQLPRIFQENLGRILTMEIRFLKEIDEANEKDDDEEEEEEEEGEEDEEEDDDDYEDDDGEDVTNADELAYLKTLKNSANNNKMLKYALEEVDDYEDDMYGNEDDYSSPIDDVDELVLFYQAVQAVSARSPQIFAPIQASLPPAMKESCAVLLTKAHAKSLQPT